MDDRQRTVARAAELAAGFLETLDDRPLWPRSTYPEMIEALGGELPAAGSEAVDMIEDLARRADPGGAQAVLAGQGWDASGRSASPADPPE